MLLRLGDLDLGSDQYKEAEDDQEPLVEEEPFQSHEDPVNFGMWCLRIRSRRLITSDRAMPVDFLIGMRVAQCSIALDLPRLWHILCRRGFRLILHELGTSI